MKMREFFHKNFAERVVILLYCPKGLYVNLRPSTRESWWVMFVKR